MDDRMSQFIALFLIFSCIPDMCFGVMSITQIKEAISTKILHEQNPACRDVVGGLFRPCYISTPEDYVDLIAESLPSSACRPRSPTCSDGSTTMTCVPLQLSPRETVCVCNSTIGVYNDQMIWDSEWNKKSGTDVALKKSLCLSRSWCFDLMIMSGVDYLVLTKVTQSSQITASSEYNADFPAAKIRLDESSFGCAWSPLLDDPDPWIKLDLLQPYVGVGVLIRPRCTNQALRITSAHIAASNDDIAYTYVVENLQVIYEDNSFTSWFPESVTAIYWKITPLTYDQYPAMKADIIGRI